MTNFLALLEQVQTGQGCLSPLTKHTAYRNGDMTSAGYRGLTVLHERFSQCAAIALTATADAPRALNVERLALENARHFVPALTAPTSNTASRKKITQQTTGNLSRRPNIRTMRESSTAFHAKKWKKPPNGSKPALDALPYMPGWMLPCATPTSAGFCVKKALSCGKRLRLAWHRQTQRALCGHLDLPKSMKATTRKRAARA